MFCVFTACYSNSFNYMFLCLQPVIAMTWDGWTDALAGLLRYEYEVYELGHDGSTLGENQGKMVKSPTTIELTATSVSY